MDGRTLLGVLLVLVGLALAWKAIKLALKVGFLALAAVGAYLFLTGALG